MDTPLSSKSRKRVLLIVGDEPVLSTLESLLAANVPEVRVLTASSGAKGMAIARANVLDMILSDFRMSKMDGVEFLRQARVVQADIPMVIMSADPGSEIAQRAFASAGLTHVVSEPFDIDALVRLVRSFLDRAGAAGTSPVAPGAAPR